MSFSNFFNQPQINSQCPNLNFTLLFIETNKYIPASDTINLGKKMPEKQQSCFDQQISIDLNLQQVNPEAPLSSTLLNKKRKNGCICKKIKCLKMYCECFSSGKLCTSECSCCVCSNNAEHTEQIAEAQQAIKAKAISAKRNQFKGCNCKKTQCQKKYCQCFNSGVACCSDCKCDDCVNIQTSKIDLRSGSQQKDSNKVIASPLNQ